MTNELIAAAVGFLLALAAFAAVAWLMHKNYRAQLDAAEWRARDVLDRLYYKKADPPVGADIPALNRQRTEERVERQKHRRPAPPPNPGENFRKVAEAGEREKLGGK